MDGVDIVLGNKNKSKIIEEIEDFKKNGKSKKNYDLNKTEFENMKLNKSLRRVYANNNKFFKNSMFKFGELLKKDNDDQNSEGGLEFLSLSYNDIDDECINFLKNDAIRLDKMQLTEYNDNG